MRFLGALALAVVLVSGAWAGVTGRSASCGYYRYSYVRPTVTTTVHYRAVPSLVSVHTYRALPRSPVRNHWTYVYRRSPGYLSPSWRRGFREGFAVGFERGRLFERYYGPWAPSPRFDLDD